MRLRSITILASLAVLPASAPALGQGYHRGDAYGGYPRVAYGTGFAEPLLQGDYIGAPFAEVPSPTRLVPTPWSYGTYGVPTASGIAPAPTGQPTLTVIHAQGARKIGRQPVSVQDEALSDMRVVSVSVPRR